MSKRIISFIRIFFTLMLIDAVYLEAGIFTAISISLIAIALEIQAELNKHYLKEGDDKPRAVKNDI
ncbi:MAG: hypothetical protein M0P61_00440 [Ignavibacteriaceae bacterium]|jgi:hypothetical protein|nr:hypothetical protein [Ignavibacteriaceae bacterium]